MMVLSEPTWTLAAPLMLPETRMIPAPLADAAAVSWERFVTVVCVPPTPPFVLHTTPSVQIQREVNH